MRTVWYKILFLYNFTCVNNEKFAFAKMRGSLRQNAYRNSINHSCLNIRSFFFSQVFFREIRFRIVPRHPLCVDYYSFDSRYISRRRHATSFDAWANETPNTLPSYRDTSVVNVSFNIGIVSRLFSVLRRRLSLLVAHVGTGTFSLPFFWETEPTHSRATVSCDACEGSEVNFTSA